MSSTLVIAAMLVLIVILLLAGAPIKPVRFAGQALVKLGIGAMLLFFLNVFGSEFGLYVPINLFTTIVTGFLGVFGLASLAAVNFFIL
ncbi:pro-sigmaK processing inhibitor BofA family protein [Aciduricibacillus chroicocephali]|uniref:Pro-sigmaK processing inhibitor BofA family protein n=1 Tax=Aciduricibacillus chroicocephali TaxID=3054939 RepID=A0ABY9KVF5_9BACI|nr:pro-sigmaK processing inhibitor BofA family protein [Bacillaceae bacterium 44XB]